MIYGLFREDLNPFTGYQVFNAKEDKVSTDNDVHFIPQAGAMPSPPSLLPRISFLANVLLKT